MAERSVQSAYASRLGLHVPLGTEESTEVGAKDDIVVEDAAVLAGGQVEELLLEDGVGAADHASKCCVVWAAKLVVEVLVAEVDIRWR